MISDFMVMGSIPEQVDVAVIGGGVGGYVAAIRAAQLGKAGESAKRWFGR